MNRPLPPNQHLAAPGKWPIVGEKSPAAGDPVWTVTVDGLVASRSRWRLEDLQAMTQVERAIDIHCVTRWSKLGARFGGVDLAALLDACGPRPEARFLSFVARSERNHSTSLPMEDALRLGAMVALTYEGKPLEAQHGGPVRIVTPGRYFYKSLKWLERIDVIATDRPGYWESQAGYNNGADPWREERYIVREIDPKVLRRALESRDFRGLDLLGIDAAGRDLSGLDARGALLRNAGFRHTELTGARFEGANLSNAHFQGANLAGASFRGADLEGAEFAGADLRGSDFSGASLLGSTFAGERGEGADLDSSTLFDRDGLSLLTPDQAEYIASRTHL